MSPPFIISYAGLSSRIQSDLFPQNQPGGSGFDTAKQPAALPRRRLLMVNG